MQTVIVGGLQTAGSACSAAWGQGVGTPPSDHSQHVTGPGSAVTTCLEISFLREAKVGILQGREGGNTEDGDGEVNVIWLVCWKEAGKREGL